ncbi:hypothetical protein BX600DRAFT_471761 [Xylariales sp. PMI_506]|nr:hypothetical protein BX600DRAFT_471761 [Xylariales sp. PMI_506]
MVSLEQYHVRTFANNVVGFDVERSLTAGVFSVLVLILGSCLCVWCTTIRCNAITDWRKVPAVTWVVLTVNMTTLIFIVASALVQYSGWEVNSEVGACAAATLICQIGYMGNKNGSYIFLCERVHITRSSVQHCDRLKSKLYLFNIGILVAFGGFCIVGLIYRVTTVKDGTCYIGVTKSVLLGFVAVEFLLNTYFTILFLINLLKLYGWKIQHKNGAMPVRSTDVGPNANSMHLRKCLIRTAIGSFITSLSTVTNLSTLMALNGEPAWLCLLLCEVDTLFYISVMHWITSKDNISTKSKMMQQSADEPELETHGLAA